MVVALPPAVLQQIGDALAVLRPSSCAITRSTAVDAQDVPTGGSPSAIASVGCRIDVSGRRAIEAVFGPIQETNADVMVFLPRGTMLTRTDRIVATIEGVATTFEIIDVGIGSHLAEVPVLCTRVR